MTWRTWAIRPATTPSSRCSGTSRSATTQEGGHRVRLGVPDEEVKLPADKLWATVYKDDDEAFELWRTVVGIPADRIVRLGEKDNFWSMGDTGPCGPCSEIIIDQGPEMSCGKPAAPWGATATATSRSGTWCSCSITAMRTGKLTPLPKPSIDTGMGLERLAAVCQKVRSNFETDLFQPIIREIAALAGVPYHKDGQTDISYQVCADHLRP